MKAQLNVVNFLLFVVGMTIVWNTTTGWVPLLGAFIASIHVSYNPTHE